jgi:hypothetical protein
MKTAYTSLVQSKFFNPAFNSAIFDGPIRIYFAQSQEAQALKIYFNFQQEQQALVSQAKKFHDQTGSNVLIMLYPNHDTFEMTFEEADTKIVCETLHGDILVGIDGPIEDNQIREVIHVIVRALHKNQIEMPRPELLA